MMDQELSIINEFDNSIESNIEKLIKEKSKFPTDDIKYKDSKFKYNFMDDLNNFHEEKKNNKEFTKDSNLRKNSLKCDNKSAFKSKQKVRFEVLNKKTISYEGILYFYI